MNKIATLAFAAVWAATTAMAGGHANWTSVDAGSSVAFGSIKNDYIGEVHTFNTVSGTVSEAGDVAITIDLTSVETNIDIRNERLIEHLFQAGKARAVLTGAVDMDVLNALEVGTTAVVDFDGALAFAGVEADIETQLLVARLGQDRVLVTTADLIMLATEDLELDAGVDILMDLAGLSGITRVAPVSVRMVFEK
ncbi:YceI family protein [Roseobacter sp.]|uniref:YceI family protein n=1 Tax=Roseobacter sp. TaxID=1907202 RepID=UPI003297F8EC